LTWTSQFRPSAADVISNARSVERRRSLDEPRQIGPPPVDPSEALERIAEAKATLREAPRGL
jgi:hypothetical protein